MKLIERSVVQVLVVSVRMSVVHPSVLVVLVVRVEIGVVIYEAVTPQ